ncbi:helix-turn-helix domain-containing protein [Erwinia persicina]|nr:helix-turn-helix domain-containing protein [Erwinia persicina]
MSSGKLGNTLIRTWQKGEWIIARYLGLKPSVIRLLRYFDSCGPPEDRRP